jgi:hypothetical protein
MPFSCRPVEASFFDTAPMRFKNAVELDARPAQVFAIFEDGESWPRWFAGIRKVVWTSKLPYGVGTTRTVWLTLGTVDEHFFRWEQDRRLSFYLTALVFAGGHSFARTTSTDSRSSELSPDERARETEQRMTDDERFSLIVSLTGAVPFIRVPRVLGATDMKGATGGGPDCPGSQWR